jgi:hypothetical protein
MRVESDPPDEQRGPLSELLRLQSEFQARLADETLRYLRRLQGAFAPAAPGTVVRPDGDGELRAAGRPGQRVTLRLEAENRQRVHCLVTPMLTPLVARTGTTWFPAADPSPAATLLAPGEVGAVTVELVLPAELPADVYKGALVLQGFREGGVPVTIDASDGAPAQKRPAATRHKTARSRPRKKTRRKRAAR